MTEKDKLEQFISENREAFDVFEPDDQLWEHIAPVKGKVRKMTWKFYLIRVATVVAIFIASYFFHDWMSHRGEDQTAINVTENAESMEQIKVLVEAEGFYTGRINSAKQEITQLAEGDHQLVALMNSDLDELTGIFESLKNDLNDNSDNQEVIEAMIQNYRIRLEILNEMLAQLKKSEPSNEKQNKHEI